MHDFNDITDLHTVIAKKNLILTVDRKWLLEWRYLPVDHCCSLKGHYNNFVISLFHKIKEFRRDIVSTIVK